MAITVSLAVPVNGQPRRRHNFSAATNHSDHMYSFLRFPGATHGGHMSMSLSSSDSSSSPSSPWSVLQTPLRTGRFMTNKELENLELLANFNYHQDLASGFLWVRVMREEEMDMAAALLAESFAESMMIVKGYAKLLEFLVKNYLVERRAVMPHGATLLAVYRENGEEDFELAGTVEITFDKKGANATPPTPIPPKNSPYLCNMAVSYPLRRRGIGWHLLKAAEELISELGSSREVYLHCRLIDKAPLSMYAKAGYSVVETDSFLSFLTLQRRKHLMCKSLPAPVNENSTSEISSKPC